MLAVKEMPTRKYQLPQVFCARKSDSVSCEVLKVLEDDYQLTCFYFDDPQELEKFLPQNGYFFSKVVAVYDGRYTKGWFTNRTVLRGTDQSKMPAWVLDFHVPWAVEVSWRSGNNPKRCARQMFSDYHKKFEDQLDRGQFPWGKHRAKESPPVQVSLGRLTDQRINDLNKGPDSAAYLADSEHSLEMPVGYRISWLRVPQDPVLISRSKIEAISYALQSFQEVSAKLAQTDYRVKYRLAQGLDITNSAIRDVYLNPQAAKFSIDRSDLHWRGQAGFFASEIDEMPGGLPELYNLDSAYGRLNQAAWSEFFDQLFEAGPVLFVVSPKWSNVYWESFSWLVKKLKAKGYEAELVSQDLSQVKVSAGVYYRQKKFATVWRQFPIFEASVGVLSEIVLAAQRLEVALVPEFAHFGSKTWFATFWEYLEYYQQNLGDNTFKLLKKVLPVSKLITSKKDFPVVILDQEITSWEELFNLRAELRSELVLKVTGANSLTARSYGVLMGVWKLKVWQEWLESRLHNKEPFIIQEREPTSVFKVPVRNIKTNRDEIFMSRVLIRPWVLNGKLVSASGTATPQDSLKVHGRIDMASLPVEWV